MSARVFIAPVRIDRSALAIARLIERGYHIERRGKVFEMIAPVVPLRAADQYFTWIDEQRT